MSYSLKPLGDGGTSREEWYDNRHEFGAKVAHSCGMGHPFSGLQLKAIHAKAGGHTAEEGHKEKLKSAVGHFGSLFAETAKGAAKAATVASGVEGPAKSVKEAAVSHHFSYGGVL